jgi:hypothetical protein
LNEFLGYSGTCSVPNQRNDQDELGEHTVLAMINPRSGKWNPASSNRSAFLQPRPLFRKLDPKIVEEERSKLGKLGD